MKVLMISGDKNLLSQETDAAKRLALQRSVVDALDVFVWPQVHTKWQIWRALRKGKYDVITSQDPFWRGLLAIKLGWLTNTRVNIQVHADLSGQTFIKHILAQIVLRHADSIRVVSDRIKQQVEKMGGKNVSVLPIFIDLEKFRSNKRELNPNHKTIMWIGRFEKEKDPDAAISLLAAVRDAGINAGMVLLGEGSLKWKVMKSGRSLPYYSEIDFPGWRDPMEYLPKTDVVISTSNYESWGASIVEALAAGIPVVAPDVGIAKEAGAIVVPREKLAEAVISELKNPTQGKLQLPLLTAEEWAKAWRDTL